ncbi:Tetratricopeptide repeat protein 36-like protein [Phlyctema vagabunda]|uniref:Tetratricopeptide repeat protein 36-like protein n=1 Tax=Phlyctema vagabunda TaxID=108571 RepID=A0ABR4PW20_9HELO
MATSMLTQHDLGVLDKIKDPESGPSAPILIDDSLPRDPKITDTTVYQRVAQRERDIILQIQELELQIAGLKPSPKSQASLTRYEACITSLDELVEDFPNYASARNNRAQALRRVFGDGMLVNGLDTKNAPTPLHAEVSASQAVAASKKVLDDLDTAITLLCPRTPFAGLSPQAAKTLSQAYTQRGALYHLTSKSLSSDSGKVQLRVDASRKEAEWTVGDFEENASRNFMLGGRYGNEVARQLAVSTNPVAKLCGDMVREAMKKEYSGTMI